MSLGLSIRRRTDGPSLGEEAPTSLPPSSERSRLRGRPLGRPALKWCEKCKDILSRQHTFVSAGQHPTEASDCARARDNPVKIDRPAEMGFDRIGGGHNQVMVQIVVSRVDQKGVIH